MTSNSNFVTLFVFAISLCATFVAAAYGRRRSIGESEGQGLHSKQLNKWLVGISAGTTGNSGFIVTGAVGLGYTGGIHWILLPLCWLLGDIVFWMVFPPRLNRLASESKATTLSEFLVYGLKGRYVRGLSLLVSLVLVSLLCTYTAAQWLAGRKFLFGATDIGPIWATIMFAGFIILYSSIGGFRGSVYSDAVQAVIRLIGTVVALAAVIRFAMLNSDAFMPNLHGAGDSFLRIFPEMTAVSVVGFVIGYSAAALGFGLGQPQIVSRYFAGRNPSETQAAWWIYIGFVQFTWISMTIFGVILRGVMPNLADPEMGLSVFFHQHMGSVATGIILADVFATIAATANGILIAVSQSIYHDILAGSNKRVSSFGNITSYIVGVVGIVTIILSLILPGNVFSIAIYSVSLAGAAVAGPVVIKALNRRHDAFSLLVSIICGLLSAIIWRTAGLEQVMNEAAVGLVVSLLANSIIIKLAPRLSKV